MKALKFLAAGLAALFLLAACAMTPGRYKVLSFFFDGVPNPKTAKSGQAGNQNQNQNQGNEQNGKRKFTGSIHGPYAARLCTGCHKPFTNELRASRREICYRCHVFNAGNKWVHGPVASGGCLVCHDPHSSRYRYLLLSASDSFCLHCHNIKDIKKNKAHQGVEMKCTTCHNPHMADNRFLLK